MNKELYISSTPHETKVAIVEDDQLAEIIFERENEYTLAGSIYKGRVTRVLPGMQSAFVDVGLERDAFLYVTDFLEENEDQEEFENVMGKAPQGGGEAREPRRDERRRQPRGQKPWEKQPAPATPEPAVRAAEYVLESGDGEGEAEAGEEPGETPQEQQGAGARRWRGRRRRRGRGGRGLPESKFVQADSSPDETQVEAREADEPEQPEYVAEDSTGVPPPPPPRVEPTRNVDRIVLPGETLAKYSQSGGRDAAALSEQTTISGGYEEAVEEPPVQPRGQELGFAGESERPGEQRAPRGFDRGRGRDRDRGRDRGRFRDRDRDRDRQPREPREPREAGSAPSYPPIVLPGESIAKYRDVPAGAAAEPGMRGRLAADLHAPEVEEPIHNVTEVEEPEQRVEISAAARRTEPEVVTEAGPAAFATGGYSETVEALSTASDHFTHVPAETPAAYSDQLQSVDAPERREEAIETVAAHEAAPETELAQTGSARGEEPAPLAEAARTAHTFEPGSGVIEEEVIEEEESDYPGFAEPESAEFEELEEVERMPGAAGEETIDISDLGDAVQDEYIDRTASGEFESEGLEDEEEEEEGEEEAEFEGAEVMADAADPDHPDYEGRAEVRASAGTAGFQRAERPGDRRRERFQRGRRGGKRMGRGRSNIQRANTPTIAELLKEGQEILVQIAKEPIAKKGARITSHIALPGRFLVYMPTVNHMGVSRKIASEEERQRLKRILISERGEGHGGFIVRTAAAGASEDDLRADIRFLINLWTEIKQRAESAKAPALIYHDLNVVERTLRDQVTSNFSQIWVDSEQEYERILRFMSRFQPSMVRRVKLYTKDTPLFEQFNVQEELNKALKSKVWLKSGGYIVINQTEALVAVDINTGKFVGKTARLEDTIVKTNIDAIQEIVRQIRLRDLGGIIIIDFIDMDERKNRARVMQALEDALKNDRAPSKVLQFNDFGLVAITRKRVKQSLERTLGVACNTCVGTGIVKSPTTIANEIWVELKKMSKQLEPGRDVVLRANPDVVKILKANGGKRLQELEDLTQRTVILKADPVLHQEQFDIN